MSRPSDRDTVLFVQYANPALYPPTEHAALLLARAGAHVHLMGIALQADTKLAEHERISVDLMSAPPGGWRLKLAYLRFVWWVGREAARLRPSWIYASDPLSTPAAWLAARMSGARTVYHEHDAPPAAAAGVTARLVGFCRRRLVARADLAIVPASGRANLLREATGRREVTVVWNTPRCEEVAPARVLGSGAMRLLYHGSIVPARVPDTLLHALATLPADVTLCITGYDPTGGAHLDHLRRVADDLNLGTRVDLRGVVATRRELLRECATFDVGLALLPLDSGSANEQTMLGASNKVFDYLASGLAVIVPDRPDWRETFVDPGYGLACDGSSIDSLRAAIGQLRADPDARLAMAERGRRRILAEWHYERGFRPVAERMLGPGRQPWKECA